MPVAMPTWRKVELMPLAMPARSGVTTSRASCNAVPMRRPLLAASALTIALAAACAATELPPEPPPQPPAAQPISPPILVTMKLEETGIDPGWMDRTADPCDSFFAYACGGFVKSTVIPSDRATWGATESVQADFFAEEVRRNLLAAYGEKGLYEGGLTVSTTLDPAFQAVADKALAEEIAQTAGITSTGIRVRLLRVRQALRQKIAVAA